jgi:hypothetical protein
MDSQKLSNLLAQLKTLADHLDSSGLSADLEVLEKYFSGLGTEKVARSLRLSACDPSQRQPSERGASQWRLPGFLEATASVLKSSGANKAASILIDLVSCLRSNDVQQAQEFVDRSRVGTQAVGKKPSTAQPEHRVIEAHAAAIATTIWNVQLFEQAFSNLKADKRAGKIEVREIARRVTNIDPPKSASRDALLNEIRSHHVLVVRDLAKADEISKLG